MSEEKEKEVGREKEKEKEGERDTGSEYIEKAKKKHTEAQS